MSAAESWFGLDRSGGQICITHSELMQWAYRNEKQFTVGWSHAFVDEKGNRLVRGPRMVAVAREHEWNDLADLLEANGLRDKELSE